MPRVVARINHPNNEWLFNESWGVDVAVSTPRLLSALVEEAVSVGDLVRLMTFRQGQAKDKALGAKGSRLTLESLQAQLAEEGSKELPIIIKADVQGSAEVLADTLAKLSDDKTRIKVLKSAVAGLQATGTENTEK